jgi:hypothetical protein
VISVVIDYKYSEAWRKRAMQKDWKETDGTVADVEVISYRNGTEYSVVFTYKVDGGYYSGTFTTYEAYRKDDTIPVLYDPANPERNNLVESEKIQHWAIGAVVCVVALIVLYAVTH